MSEKVRIDEKEQAARTFADVIQKTRNFFPEEKYRPMVILHRDVNAQYGINPHPHEIFGNSDGTGTKPELGERLFDKTGDYKYHETQAYNGVAMVADDAARFGYFVLGLLNSVDVNSAKDLQFIEALSKGMYAACEKGGFPLLNGETAELGYRTPGWGKNRLNWNLAAVTLINRDKLITGDGLKPGQPIVAFREQSIRSNGLTKAREILETAYLAVAGQFSNRKEMIVQWVKEEMESLGMEIRPNQIENVLNHTPIGENLWEQLQLPWHLSFPQETEELLKPSTIYTPIIYEAQGGVDGKVQVPLVACAHISGGGIPLKGKRMVEEKGLGIHLDPVFPDPQAVQSLMRLAQEHPHPEKGPLVNNRSASDQWNRGVGFMCVTPDKQSANVLLLLARQMGYEAEIAGEIIPEKKIEWRGETWEY